MLVIDHRGGKLLVVCIPLFLLFSCLLVCILDAFGHLVDREAGCNWYLHDINIFFFVEKVKEISFGKTIEKNY